MLDRKTILKNFTIGFLPLLVFIIADEFFGLTVGLITAITFGILETGITYLKSKVIDRFILFDTGLILSLGMVSLVLQNDIFFKVKPGLIGLILVALLGMTAFSDNPIMLKLSNRYLKGIELSSQQIKMMQKMMRSMFYVFSLHTLLVFYAAFFLSNEAWAFISGGLFYIIIGLMMGFEFLRSLRQRRKLQKSYAEEEWFDITTPQGKIIGKAPRSAVHGNPDLLHPVIHVHIINASGKIYLQKRNTNKEIQPDRWDTAIGGHVLSGETIDHALRREAEEELGLSMGEFQPLFRYVMKNNLESELVHGFLLEDEGPFYPNPGEISEAKFWTTTEIENNIGKDIFTPNFEKEYDLLKKLVFQAK
ncbi:MAG: NUDIX domain-containing protein [bacterium]|nr:MAG: NUDIX domain-containing protein [bacterium]